MNVLVSVAELRQQTLTWEKMKAIFILEAIFFETKKFAHVGMFNLIVW